MPCDQVRTIAVDLGKVNQDRLRRVLAADGWQLSNPGSETIVGYKDGVTITCPKGARASVRGLSLPRDVAALQAGIKRGYAAQTVADAAKRFGFKVQSTTKQGEVVRMKLGK